MRSSLRQRVSGGVLVSALVTGAFTPGGALSQDGTWTREFAVDRRELGPTGRNPCFPLEPGYAIVLEKGAERVTWTMLNETRMVDGSLVLVRYETGASRER